MRYGPLLSYVANIAGSYETCLYFDLSSYHDSSELEDPTHVMLRLVDSSVADLPSNILAVYLSAALKVYGYWASVLAGKWSDHFMSVLKETVAQLQAGFQPFASSEDVEVQERVRLHWGYPQHCSGPHIEIIGCQLLTTFRSHRGGSCILQTSTTGAGISIRG